MADKLDEKEERILITNENLHRVFFDVKIVLKDRSTRQFKEYITNDVHRRTWIDFKNETWTLHITERGDRMLNAFGAENAHNRRNRETDLISRGDCSWSCARLKEHDPPTTITVTQKNGQQKKYENVHFTVESVEQNPVIQWSAPERVTRAKLTDFERAERAVQSGTLSVEQLEMLLEKTKKLKTGK
jgi:hypothetical protein